MRSNAWLLIISLLSHAVRIQGQQQQQFVPVAVGGYVPVTNQAATIPLQQAPPPPPPWGNPLPATYPAAAAPQYMPAENVAPTYSAPSQDPMHNGGVALNLVVNAGPGPSPAPAYALAPAAGQQPMAAPVYSSGQTQPISSPMVGGNWPTTGNGQGDGNRHHTPSRSSDLPDNIIVDGHEYKLNDGDSLVVHDQGNHKHRNSRDDDNLRKHHRDDDEDDDDRDRHRDSDRKKDDKAEKDEKPRSKSGDSSDDKPKKKDEAKPKKPPPQLPVLPATPAIPSVPTLQPATVDFDATKAPIYPGEVIAGTQPTPAATNITGQAANVDVNTIPAIGNATAPSSPSVIDPVSENLSPTAVASNGSVPNEGRVEQNSTDPGALKTNVIKAKPEPKPSVDNGATPGPQPDPITPSAQTSVADNINKAAGPADPPDPASAAALQQPALSDATLAPLSLPSNPGQWANPIAPNQRFAAAKAILASHPDSKAGAAAPKATSRPGQVPDLPALPPGMESFHKRPDAVKKPPLPPAAPVPKAMMPKPKGETGPLNTSSPVLSPPSAAPAVVPEEVPATESVPATGTGGGNETGPPRPDPVPVIVVPETEPTVVDTPAPTTAPTTAPTPEPTKKSKWAFGHGPEYNYEPSTGRKPADQTNGDPFGKKDPEKEEKKSEKKGKKKTKTDDDKKKAKTNDDKKDKKTKDGKSPDQQEAVNDMFSNIMGKLKF